MLAASEISLAARILPKAARPHPLDCSSYLGYPSLTSSCLPFSPPLPLLPYASDGNPCQSRFRIRYPRLSHQSQNQSLYRFQTRGLCVVLPRQLDDDPHIRRTVDRKVFPYRFFELDPKIFAQI